MGAQLPLICILLHYGSVWSYSSKGLILHVVERLPYVLNALNFCQSVGVDNAQHLAGDTPALSEIVPRSLEMLTLKLIVNVI